MSALLCLLTAFGAQAQVNVENVAAQAIEKNTANPNGQEKYTDYYYKRVAEFAGQPPITSRDIVFLGNSLTEGGSWSEWFPATESKLARKGGHIRNRGIIGDVAMGIYDRLYQILLGKPRKIFLLVGVNDISHDLTADSIVFMIGRVVERIRVESPDTKLYIQTLLPFNESFKRYKRLEGKSPVVLQVNEGIKKLAKQYRITCIDLYPYFLETKDGMDLRSDLTRDGLHLTSPGYGIWVKRIKKYVR